jgi:hypothetical protein
MAGTVTDLMNSIAKMEGYNVSGSIAQRNNNPGNLRSGVGQVGSENTVSGTFATFATPADGWAALHNQIDIQAGQGQTLRDFIYQYAPPSENNTSSYLNVLVADLGVSADSSLSDLGMGVSNASVVDSSGSVSSALDNLVNGTTGTIDWAMVGLVVVGVMLVMQD